MHPYLGKLLYRTIQSWRQEPVFECLHELEESQWYQEDSLRNLQWNRLTRLLVRAYETVSFYRERFQAIDLTPQDVRSPSDFTHIPVLTKEELRSQRPRLLSSVRPRRISAMATSGSSGDPLTVIRDRNSTAYHRAAKYRGHRWFGIEIGARETRLWGYLWTYPQGGENGSRTF